MKRPTVTADDAGLTLLWEDEALQVRAEGVRTDGDRVHAVITLYARHADGSLGHMHGPDRLEATSLRDRQQLVAGLSRKGRHQWPVFVDQLCTLIAWSANARHDTITDPTLSTLQELLAEEAPARPEIVPGILTEGVWIFGGAPKQGKSWLAYALLWAVAAGGRALGQIPVERGQVAYLALEDTKRRVQKRAPFIAQGAAVPPGFFVELEWPRLNEGGLEKLDNWLARKGAGTRLVVIDTLQRVRANTQSGGRLYQEDYEALQGLAGLAGKHGCCILVIHHLRKGAVEDPLEALSGTMGLSGAADGIWVLDRKRGAPRATLHIVGRDLDDGDQALALAWNEGTRQFNLLGDAGEVGLDEDRRAVIALLSESSEALGPKEIAEEVEIPHARARKLVRTLAADGYITAVSYGRYRATAGAGAKMGDARNTWHTWHTRTLGTDRTVDDQPPTDAPPERKCAECTECASVPSVPSVRQAAHLRADEPAQPDAGCPRCGQGLNYLTCYACATRWCEDCRGLTGSIVRRLCIACGLRESG